jgi:hypothetical protein
MMRKNPLMPSKRAPAVAAIREPDIRFRPHVVLKKYPSNASFGLPSATVENTQLFILAMGRMERILSTLTGVR